MGNGDGSFGAPIAYSVNSAGDRLINVSFTLGDLNGDSKPDFLVNAGNAPNPDTFFVLLNKGDGTFGPPTTPFVGGPIGNVLVGDFNNDKKMDIVAETSNGLGLLPGNGDGTFQPATLIAKSACTAGCNNPVSRDFSGDGNLDLIVSTANGYQVLIGKGDGTFSVPPVVNAGTFGGFLVADFNGLWCTRAGHSTSDRWLRRLRFAGRFWVGEHGLRCDRHAPGKLLHHHNGDAGLGRQSRKSYQETHPGSSVNELPDRSEIYLWGTRSIASDVA
jgi:hypothetical protein